MTSSPAAVPATTLTAQPVVGVVARPSTDSPAFHTSKSAQHVISTWKVPTATQASMTTILGLDAELGHSADIATISDAPAKPAYWAVVSEAKPNSWDSQIFGKVPGAMVTGDHCTVRFYAHALSADAGVQVVVMNNGGAWTQSCNRTVMLGTEWRLHEVGFTAAADQPAGTAMIALHLGQRKQMLEIAGITITNHGQKDPVVVIQEGPEWRAVDLADPDIVPGSALDFSSLVPLEKAGSHGRVIVNPAGKLAFTDHPETPVRFLGCSINMGPNFESLRHDSATLDGDNNNKLPTTKDDIAAFVVRMRKQGYNLFRPHFLDSLLMQWAKEPLKPDVEALDRFDWMVHCCKENGVYLYFDCATRPGAWSPGPGWGGDGRDHKMEIYADPKVRALWADAVRMMVTRTNPYTKTRLVDDPAVAVMLFYNEQEIAPWGEEWFPNELHPALRTWVKKKYPTEESLKAAWGGELPAGETLDTLTGHRRWGQGQRSRDINRFMFEAESEMLAYYQKTIREIGYQGLTTQFDCTMRLQNSAVRSQLPVLSMHTYAATNSSWVSPGSRQRQDSSILTDDGYSDGLWFRYTSDQHFADRPMMITEYQQQFWSRWRHEEGLMMGGYGAYQGYDALMTHAHPVMLSVNRPTLPYFAGSDPIARSQQVLTNLLFSRGDVAQAKKHVQLEFDDDLLFKEGKSNLGICWSFDQSRLALLAGYGIAYHDNTGAKRGAVAGAKAWNLRDIPKFPDAVAAMRAEGILAKDNRTDVAKGIFQTDTGELTMTRQKARLDVVTPRTAGTSMMAGDHADLGPLTVAATTRDACIAASAIDGAPLASSRRILVVVATDALNSGMSFADAEHCELISIGQLPILLRTGSYDLRLALTKSDGLKAWGLGMDGSRQEELPLVSDDQGRVRLAFDTAKTKGPWVYVEIAER